jgi:hypothetical protein
MTVLLLGGTIPRLMFQTGINEKHCIHFMTGGPPPVPQLVRQTGMNGFEINWRRLSPIPEADSGSGARV